jgi:ParB family chromosome partitioning protein
MIRKSGLGKGLGSLITENHTESENNTVSVSINDIKPNENQPRKYFDTDKISKLAESIKEYGIIQPIVVVKEGDVYTIVAGERRWRAAKLLGLKEVPVVIMGLTKKELLEISLIENLQREDLNPIEEAIAYKQLINDFHLTQEELGKKVGKSRAVITNCIRLLNLDNRVQSYLIDGVISEGHARLLLSIENFDIQYQVAQKIIDDNLTVRDTEKYIKNLQKQKNNISQLDKALTNNSYLDDIKNRLEGKFGTKIIVKDKNNKGKIEIEYYSNEDLQRILDIIEI